MTAIFCFGKIRNVMLSQSDFKTLIKNTSNQNLKKALTLSYHFGLRCAECAKLKFEDIKSNGISIIDSKGKRSRFIPAETEKQIYALYLLHLLYVSLDKILS